MRIVPILSIGAIAFAVTLSGTNAALADIVFAGFESTFDTVIPGTPFHKDLTPDPPDPTGPDILDTNFVCGGGAAAGVTEGNCALEINHPPDWGTDEFYMILSSQGNGNAGELAFLDLIAQSTELRFDVTTFGGPTTPDEGPTYRQIFVVLNTNYFEQFNLGSWYDANSDPDAQRTLSNDSEEMFAFPLVSFDEEFLTTTVSLDLSAPLAEGGNEDNKVFWQALAQLIQSDIANETIDPAELSFQMYLVFQGADDPFTNPVQIVMDNFMLIGPEATGLAGDYNENGIVDAADYALWLAKLGDSQSLPNDDTPGVGQDDYDRWKLNFGLSSASGSSGGSIPEPTSLLLLIAAVAAIGSIKRIRAA